MNKSVLFTAILSCLGFLTNAQTWSGEVAQIFYNKCAKCHHAGGISSTSLTTFTEVSPMVNAIATYVGTDKMPPWPPSNTYQQYQHNRALSTTDKTTILTWIGLGAPEGNSANTPPVPIFTVGAILGAGDLTVKMPKYMSKASAQGDDYACFSVPSGLLVDRKIKSVEIIPGNIGIVHHALIFLDPAAVEVTDSSAGNCSAPANTTTKLITGYTPGATPMTLPTVAPLKLGMTMKAGSNVYFNMHYPNGSYGEFDSTKVIFHFYPEGETGVREVFADAILENWNFSLPANQIHTVTDSYPALTNDISILSVFPHQHLLGKSIKAFAILPGTLDTLKFANLTEWDFHWQDFYFFKNILFAPVGTIIKGTGTYDNTVNNPNNPNSPPITVYPGLNTSDEMFLVYFHYMLHQAGDESYDLDALMGTTLLEMSAQEKGLISIAPNPSSNDTKISFDGKVGDNLTVYIYDTQGNVVNKLISNSPVSSNRVELNWNGTNETGSTVRKGVYFVSINLNGKFMTERIIRY
jgi:hypothetical protein